MREARHHVIFRWPLCTPYPQQHTEALFKTGEGGRTTRIPVLPFTASTGQAVRGVTNHAHYCTRPTILASRVSAGEEEEKSRREDYFLHVPDRQSRGAKQIW